jgi:hypothetical protein
MLFTRVRGKLGQQQRTVWLQPGLAGNCGGLEAVTDSIRNGLGMLKAGDRGGAGQLNNTHSNAVLLQVHNTL